MKKMKSKNCEHPYLTITEKWSRYGLILGVEVKCSQCKKPLPAIAELFFRRYDKGEKPSITIKNLPNPFR